ncbi:MAG: heparinase II/III family protein [Saprospiraceae bacterium]|nr:heparinase II/III family protein [Saprospiraceae bacterium]
MKYLLIFCVIAWQLPANAQIKLRNILGRQYTQAYLQKVIIPKNDYHPYPKSPEEWSVVLLDSVKRSILQAGESLLNYKFEPISATIALDFVRSGDRERHSQISFGKRNSLMTLIFAESIEGKGRFTESILNGIWSICEESYWGVPAHISGTGLPDVENPIVDLFTAETAAVLSLADYFIGEQLDQVNKLIRQRIYTETKKRLFDPLMIHSDKYSWLSKTNPVNNWNPWIMSNWIVASLLLEKDEMRRAQMIHGSMVGLDSYLNSLGEDGGCDEGPSYWFAAGASVYDCLELLHLATKGKVDIYSEPLIQKMSAYIYKTHIDGFYFVNFADADPKLRPDGLLLSRMGQALSDKLLVQMGTWAFNTFPDVSNSISGFHRPRKIQNLLTIRNQPPNPGFYKPLKDAWINDIQVLTARAENGLYLATHGGHNAESHNHNDVGDFIVYADGEPVIIDAGRGNYTARTFSSKRYELWFTQSQYHNLPVVNGYGQLAGRTYEAKNVSSLVNTNEAVLNMDIAAAYPQEAGIQTWTRSVKLNRLKNQVEISDDYSLNQKPNSLQQIFMTVCKTDLSVNGTIKLTTTKNATYTIQYDPNQWTAASEYPSTEGMEYSSFKTKWDSKPVQRIVLNNINLSQTGKSMFVISKN